jgi:hypothetical protein
MAFFFYASRSPAQRPGSGLNADPHLVDCQTYKGRRTAALAEWRQIAA